MLHVRKRIAVGFALLALLVAPAVFAQSSSPEAVKLREGGGDPVAGKEKSFLCQGCHGADGISFEPVIPKLAGQYGHYIVKQVHDYQSGARSHPIMNAMAGTIVDDADLVDIGAYFASQVKMKGTGGPNNPVGENIFLHGDITKSRIACYGCHGLNGKGSGPKSPMFPVIGGQQKEYIRGQLTNFRDGYRTNSPNGIMNLMTKQLTDAEIDALAEYISAQ